MSSRNKKKQKRKTEKKYNVRVVKPRSINTVINDKIFHANVIDDLSNIYYSDKEDINYINIISLFSKFSNLVNELNENIDDYRNFFNDLIDDIKNNIIYCETSQICDIYQSLALLKIINYNIFDYLSHIIITREIELDSTALASIFKSLGMINMLDENLFDFLINEVINKNFRYNPYDIVNLISGLADLNINDEIIFKMLNVQILDNVKIFNNDQINIILWVLSYLNVKDYNTFNIFVEFALCIKDRAYDFTQVQIISILKSYATINIYDNFIFENFIKRITIDDLNSLQITQLKYVYLYLKYERNLNNFYFRDDVLELIKSIVIQQNIVSDLKSECLLYLDLMNTKYIREKRIDDLIVDTYLPEYNAIIEINDVYHYNYKGYQISGYMEFKNRILKAMNYNVISISYWDWNKLKTSNEKKIYLEILFRLFCI